MQSDSVGVERRRLPFTLIENIILEDQELGPVDVLVYIALAKHADADGTCWPSLATIARLARVCRSSAAQAIKHLEARGYLRRTARFRPDGGVTSNVYKLGQIEVTTYPVVQADPPRPPGGLAPVHQVDTNYIHLELEPTKKREAPPTPAARPSQAQSSAEAPLPLSFLLTRMKTEAQARGAPLVVGRDFSVGIGELAAAGVPCEELLQVFTTCISTAPERVTFFPRDFLKWRKVWRERSVKTHQGHQDKTDRETREREQATERERILREREDPKAAEEIEKAMARLPWRRM